MPVRKIAISLPEDVLRNVDRLAKRSRTTRSGLITRVLREVSHASTQAELTDRINQLFEDSSLSDEQIQTSQTFLQAAEKDILEGDDNW